MKNLKKRKYKYINGVKGMVTIFLSFIMTPTLGIALTLVEADRYQSVQQNMKEIIDGSASSTLADYDTYLNDRFGLLAVEQSENPEKYKEVFEDYMDENVNTLGNAATIRAKETNGVSPLSDPGVLRKQVLENGKIQVVTHMEESNFPINTIVNDSSTKQAIRDALDVSKIVEESKYVDNLSTMAKESNLLSQNIKKYYDIYALYENIHDEYGDAVDDVNGKIDYIISWLRADYEIEFLEGFVNQAQSALDNLKVKITQYIDEVNKLDTALTNVVNKSTDLKSVVDSNPIPDGTFCKPLYNHFKDMSDRFQEKLQSWIREEIYRKKIDELKKELHRQLTYVENFDIRSVNVSWNNPDSEWTKFREDMGGVNGVLDTELLFKRFYNDIKDFSDVTIAKVTPETGCTDTLEGLAKFLSSLSRQPALYDQALAANVNQMSMANVIGMDSNGQRIIEENNINELCLSALEFVNKIKSPINYNTIAGLYDKLSVFMLSYKSFLDEISDFDVTSLSYLESFLEATASEDFGMMITTFGYGIYNLPNRTTCRTGESLSGYKFDQIGQLAGGVGLKKHVFSVSECVSGAISDFQGGSGNNTMFKGAEGEYLLFGSNNEVVNQTGVFMKILKFRFVTNLIGTFQANGAFNQCERSGIYGICTQSLLSIGESLADAIVLVNGNDITKKTNSYEYLVKEVFYLSPQGIKSLMEDIRACDSGDTIWTSISNYANKAACSYYGAIAEEKQGTIKLSYDETLLFLCFAGVSQTEFELRLQNIINSEAYTKYKNEYVFKLDNSFTTLKSEVRYDMNPLFESVGLTENGLFSGNISQYISY